MKWVGIGSNEINAACKPFTGRIFKTIQRTVLSHFNQHNAEHQHAQADPAFAVEALLEQHHAHDDGDDDAEAAP